MDDVTVFLACTAVIFLGLAVLGWVADNFTREAREDRARE